ncbi:hypothetical protein BD626DRAFT_508530 [Schizophyllum amplum]|uniref:Uncharacterized protein n=1 Tax=Schizophyllum amplum TaxID=97359 RepID=A0A550C2Z2_9AGAR|nr:hypothetical protein BD626DRAFT_508530 [Auriculariopsis ampla]
MATEESSLRETTDHPPLIRKDTSDLLGPHHEEDNGSTDSTASSSSHSSRPPSPQSSSTTLPSTVTSQSEVTCTAPSPRPRLRSQPSIKFAPLPELDRSTPRRHPPLGIATRGQLMRRRKLMAAGSDPDAPDGDAVEASDTPSGTTVRVYRGVPDTGSKRGKGKQRVTPDEEKTWTREELSNAPRLIEDVVAEHTARANRRLTGYESSDDDEHSSDDDPIIQFGRIVKGAGKHLWRKMSNKDLRPEPQRRPPPPLPKPKPGLLLLTAPGYSPRDENPHADVKFQRAPGEMEGNVWDEEVSDPERFAAQNKRGL